MMFHFYIPEGICFAVFVAFVARGYTMQSLSLSLSLSLNLLNNTVQQDAKI
jgi:hypothetical protein